jgi:hypothetical protein
VKDTGRARVPPRTRPFDAGQASVIACRASQKQGLRILLYLYESGDILYYYYNYYIILYYYYYYYYYYIIELSLFFCF